jgi:hypothetical protein
MRNFSKIALLSLLVLVFTHCKKKPDNAPVGSLTDGKNYSVPELRAIATCTDNCSKEFAQESFFCGVVLADEISGNFYKEIYVRDRYNTGAIRIDFLFSKCNFFVGDSVRLNLKGYDVNINATTGMLEIDSVDYDKHMVRYARGANPQPNVVSLSQSNYTDYYCDLITINNVKFSAADTSKIYADPILQASLNRVLTDCGGNSLTVRTSNYASFAQQLTPSGFGSITGIATAYGTTRQMAIRNPSEVNMHGSGSCVTYHTKNFDDAFLTSGGWSQIAVTNSAVAWTASSFGTAKFAKISGYIGGNQNSESWMISPALDLSAASNPILTFVTAAKFAGNPLEVWVSTNYSSGLPSTASWTQVTGFALSPNNPGNYTWTNSGIVSLNNFKTSNTRIAFKYLSTTAGATTYEVDDITIREN